MNEPIRRIGQNFSHITPEGWRAMGPQFEKAQADILKKIEKGEYEQTFGSNLSKLLKDKYDAHVGTTARVAHCGPCTPLKEKIITLLAKLDLEDQAQDLEAVADDTRAFLDLFAKIEVESDVPNRSPDTVVAELYNSVATLNWVQQRIEENQMTVPEEWPKTEAAGAAGMERLGRVRLVTVQGVLKELWGGKVPTPKDFEALLKENDTDPAEFFQGLGMYARNEGWPKEYTGKVAQFFSAWGYGPETYWIRAFTEGEPGVPAGMPKQPRAPRPGEKPAPVQETTDQPAPAPAPAAKKPAAPAAPAAPAGAPAEQAAPISGDLATKLQQALGMDPSAPPHRWRVVMRRKDTNESTQTENTYTARGLKMSIDWLKKHPVYELVDIVDLGEGKTAAFVARIIRAQTEEAEEKFKGGTPIIFTQEVELSFDALDAKGSIKENMTGKIKKVLDADYIVDIAGQIYKVPKSIAPHVMDIFVGSVVSQEHAGDDVVIDDMSQAPMIAGEGTPPLAPGAGPAGPAAEIPPNAAQPQARVLGRVVVGRIDPAILGEMAQAQFSKPVSELTWQEYSALVKSLEEPARETAYVIAAADNDTPEDEVSIEEVDGRGELREMVKVRIISHVEDGQPEEGVILDINDKKPGDTDILIWWTNNPPHGIELSEVHPEEIEVIGEPSPEELAQAEEKKAQWKGAMKGYDDQFEDKIKSVVDTGHLPAEAGAGGKLRNLLHYRRGKCYGTQRSYDGCATNRAQILQRSAGDEQDPDAKTEGQQQHPAESGLTPPQDASPFNNLQFDEIVKMNGIALLQGGGGGASRFFQRYKEIIQSAIERPEQVVFGQISFSTLPLKVASMAHTLVTEHPFGDGNHRTTAVVVLTTLSINGKALPDAYATYGTPESKELYLQIEKLGTREMSLEQFADWLSGTIGEPSEADKKEMVAEAAAMGEQDDTPDEVEEVLPAPEEDIILEEEQPPVTEPPVAKPPKPSEEPVKPEDEPNKVGRAMPITLRRRAATNAPAHGADKSGKTDKMQQDRDHDSVERDPENQRLRGTLFPKGQNFLQRLRRRATVRRMAGKATFEDLREEIQDQDHNKRQLHEQHREEKEQLHKDHAKGLKKLQSVGTGIASTAFGALLDMIEHDAPGVPADIGRRLYRGNVARDVVVAPLGGDRHV